MSLEQVSQQVAELQKAMQHVLNENEQLKQQLQPNLNAAPISIAQSTTTLSKAKPKEPDTFHGLGKIKPTQWIQRIETYFTLTSVHSPLLRIQLASSYLKDSAATWYSFLPSEKIHSMTWLEFTSLFLQRYVSVDSDQQARRALMNLKQQSMRDIDRYNHSFQYYMNQITNMAEEDRVMYYTNGLVRELQFKLVVDTDRTRTLESTIASATKLAHLFSQLQPRFNYGSVPGTQRFNNGSQHTTIHTTSNTTETAMDLSNLTNSSDESTTGEQLSAMSNSSRPRVAKLTPEERERCFKLGLCFRCRQSGHRSTQCPVFPSSGPNPKTF